MSVHLGGLINREWLGSQDVSSNYGKSLEDVFDGGPFSVVHERKIADFLGEYDEFQQRFIDRISPENLRAAKEYQGHLMKIEAVLHDPTRELLQFPVLLETPSAEETAHEISGNDRNCTGAIKEFLGRICHEAIVLRFLNAGEMRRNALLLTRVLAAGQSALKFEDEKSGSYRLYALQALVDTLCYDLAGNSMAEIYERDAKSYLSKYSKKIREQFKTGAGENYRQYRERRAFHSAWLEEKEAMRWLYKTFWSSDLEKDRNALAKYWYCINRVCAFPNEPCYFALNPCWCS